MCAACAMRERMRRCCGPGLRGATCPSGTGRGRPSTGGSLVGSRTARGPGCWNTSRSAMTRWAGGVDRRRRLHGQPRLPARGRCSQKGDADGDELEDPGRSQARQALGRSRSGLTTKVHIAVDGLGLPLSTVLTPGNVNDATTFAEVLDGIRIPRNGTGRPRTTPERVLGDKACSSRAIRRLLRRRGIAATIPERRDQAAGRPSSTRRSAATATWSGDASPVSSSSAPSRPGSTNSPTATAPDSSSLP